MADGNRRRESNERRAEEAGNVPLVLFRFVTHVRRSSRDFDRSNGTVPAPRTIYSAGTIKRTRTSRYRFVNGFRVTPA